MDKLYMNHSKVCKNSLVTYKCMQKFDAIVARVRNGFQITCANDRMFEFSKINSFEAFRLHVVRYSERMEGRSSIYSSFRHLMSPSLEIQVNSDFVQYLLEDQFILSRFVFMLSSVFSEY